MSELVIRGGRVVDPANNIDRVGDLLIRDGVVAGLDVATQSPNARIVDAGGRIVCPGFVDTYAAFREPGFEEDETIATGTAAALAGGFTSVAISPDTSPVVDNGASAEFVVLQGARAGNCRVHPIGAVTKGMHGEELAEMAQLADRGAVAFSDAKHPIANAEVFRRALEYADMCGRPVLHHPQVPELVAGGVMHEGVHSTLIGLRGLPAAAEDVMVGRDIALAELTGGRVHLTCVSTRNAVEQVRRAKQAGVRVTAGVAAHQLALFDESLQSFDANYKVDPPLRTREHAEALIAGLADGTLDVICSDHQPLASERKDIELDLAPFGIAGLETAFSIAAYTLISPGHLDWPGLVRLLATNPARLLGLPVGTLAAGVPADVTIVDPNAEWTVDPTAFRSRSRNTPFGGWTLRGRVERVFVGGKLVYEG